MKTDSKGKEKKENLLQVMVFSHTNSLLPRVLRAVPTGTHLNVSCVLLGSKWAATSPLKQKCSKKNPIRKRIVGLYLTKPHVKVSEKGQWKTSEIFSLQGFISWKPQHEALLDLPGVNAVGQVITRVSKSILQFCTPKHFHLCHDHYMTKSILPRSSLIFWLR